MTQPLADLTADLTANPTADLTANLTADVAEARLRATNAAAERFFAEHSEAIARACHAMAARFQRGARLLVYGDPEQQSDVAHVVVEFLHPVVVGKRALPTIALRARDSLETLAKDTDILLVLDTGVPGNAGLIAQARRRGMLTLWLTGEQRRGDADFHFAVPSSDPCIVQETHELLYHVLWELVHVFFEHRAVSR